VGRIAGIINRRYNELRGEQTARFSHFDCVEELAVARMLLERVTEWAGEAGMDRVVGPMGFTDQDPEGFLIEGFDEPPSIASYYNYEYVVRLLDALGWTKDVDYVVYRVDVPPTLPDVYRRVLQRVTARGVLRLIEFERRRELKRYIGPIFELMNETFTGLTGYSPLDDREMEALARRYLPVVDPRFVKVVAANHTIVGFIIGVPDLSEGFRKARGRLFPLGWLWIIRSARRAHRLDLLLGGIKEGYRSRGVDVLLGAAMICSAQRAGFEYMDSHHELETNTRMRAEMERMGGWVYKRYRIFQRVL
jgi:hypothetical protein